MKKKILIIDSANLYHHRKYDWISDKVDNIIDPFLESIYELVMIHQPNIIVLANDQYKSRHRTELLGEYKDNRLKQKEKYTERQLQADILVQALKKNLKLFDGLFVYGGINAVEADDVMAVLYNDPRLSDYEITIASQDKDLLTVVLKENLYDWYKKRFKNNEDILGFTRNQWLMYQALQGDSVDSFCGVKGVGKGTAQKLVEQYKDINTLLKNAYQDSTLTKDSWVRRALTRLSTPEGIKELKLGYDLAKIMRDTTLFNDYEKEQYEIIVNKILNYEKPNEVNISNELDLFLLENKAYKSEIILREIKEWM